MLVVEEPTIFDKPAKPGTFVVVAVDPIASTALLDDQAKGEAAAIASTRCLAILDGDVDGEYIAGMRRFSPILLLAGKGFPCEPYSWACIPVAPAKTHPENGRQPLQTVSAFPWADCYLHTLSGLPCVLSRIYQHRIVGPVLQPDAYEEVIDIVMEDDHRWAVQQDTRIAQDPQVDPPAGPQFSDVILQQSLSEPVPGPWLDTPAESPVPQLKLTFEMWMDTSSLEELADPEAVVREVKHLQQIELDWAHRVVASELSKRPETEAWLNTLGEADIPATEVGGLPNSPELDLLVKPEDAVEHRVASTAMGTRRETDSKAASLTSQRLDDSSNRSINPICSEPASATSLDNDTNEDSHSQASAGSGDRRGAPARPWGAHYGEKYLSAFRYVLSSVGFVFNIFRPFRWGLILRKFFY